MQENEPDPRRARGFVSRVQKDPAFHIEQIQGVTTLEPYQKRICHAVAEYDRIAISACHDLGKTFIMSRIVLALGSSFPGAKIITTAPTFLQVKQLLWSEIRTGFRTSRYPLGGEVLQTQWKIRDDWFALGFSPQKQAGGEGGQGTASSFQGFHGGLVVIVFDEATGIPKQIWDQAEGMLTSGHVKFIAIGNPTSRGSEFFRCFKSAAWHKIYLSCFDSPNLIANGITSMPELVAEVDRVRTMADEERHEHFKAYKTVQPKLLSLKWVIERAVEWGIEHPLFVSKVLGKFPEEDDHTLMPLGAVELAQSREYDPTKEDTVCIGVDVARFGPDKTVLSTLWGPRLDRKTVLVKRDTTEIAGHAISEMRRMLALGVSPKMIRILVDGTGVGSGVVDALREAKREKKIPQGVEIIEVNFGEGFDIKTPQGREDMEKYVNSKAKMFVLLSEDLKIDLCLPEESIYLEELPTIRYRFDSKGRYLIESKEEFKKRTGRSSPDTSDSLAIANYGRHYTGGVGEFSPEMAKNPTHGTIAENLGVQDSW